jgi:hypothetical protein
LTPRASRSYLGCMARKRRKKFLGLFGAKRKSRRGGKMAARMRAKPAACKRELGDCMRAKRGPGKCMRAFHACG